MKSEELLTVISRQEKQFDAMYRKISGRFDLPDCAMWILYFLSASEEELSQQDLIGLMMFPKQTINSAVKNLTEKGFVELFMIPGTRNKKKITLTVEGKREAESTVLRMRKAELAAVTKMGKEKMEQYTMLYKELYSCFYSAFQGEGLIDSEDSEE